jgi:hypothetical protein
MVSQIRKQRAIAVGLLARLGLDTVRLEAQGSHYIYSAWDRLLVERNGSAKTVKRGRIRISPG